MDGISSLIYSGSIWKYLLGKLSNIFSEQYYDQSIIAYSNGGFPENMSYGLGWWLGTLNKTQYFYAAGFGGNER